MVTLMVHDAPGAMFANARSTPFGRGVARPPKDADVSERYARPPGNVTLSQTLPASAPVLRTPRANTKVSREWIVRVDGATVRPRTGPSRTTPEDATRGGHRYPFSSL